MLKHILATTAAAATTPPSAPEPQEDEAKPASQSPPQRPYAYRPRAGPPAQPRPSTSTSTSRGVTTEQRETRREGRETLTSLGLLCLVSLLLALLSLVFLLRISPEHQQHSEEYAVVYEVTLALCALALSLDLCCLLVCAVQFLFAVKLAQVQDKYLRKSAVTRACAVAGFFVSIPVFLTGVILYTFVQFNSTPAIVTSAFIGLGIVFCGCAMVHNVFVWQREKTDAVKAERLQRQRQANRSNGYLPNGHVYPIASVYPHQLPFVIRPPTSTPPTPGDLGGVGRPPRPPRPPASGSVSPPGVDLSHTRSIDPRELSTLV